MILMQLDDNLKQLMKELGAAINDALSESGEISEAIQNVRNADMTYFLSLKPLSVSTSVRKAKAEKRSHQRMV